MFRPLSQRIRESAPIRLIADNRLVRAIADKPVTSAPTRRQTILVGLIPALAIAALLVTGWFVIAFHPGTFGGQLVYASIAILLLGGLLIGLRLRSVICTIIATGLYFVFVSFSTLIVSDYVLETRGEVVTAVVVDTVSNPTGCEAVSAFRSRVSGRTVATVVRRQDGTRLPGAIGFGDRTHGNNHTYRPGERVVVLVDPSNAVCMRASSDVHLVIDTIAAALQAGCVAWVFIVAPLDWRNRRLAKYRAWRDRAL